MDLAIMSLTEPLLAVSLATGAPMTIGIAAGLARSVAGREWDAWRDRW
jgi:hypothetical protein